MKLHEETVTTMNITSIKNGIAKVDQISEINIEDEITTFPLKNGGRVTIWHNQGRAAVALNSDSEWGDYKEENVFRIDEFEGGMIPATAKKIYLDDSEEGSYYDLRDDAIYLVYGDGGSDEKYERA